MFKIFRKKSVKKKESTQRIRPYFSHPDINSDNLGERNESIVSSLSNPVNPLGVAFVLDELIDVECINDVSSFIDSFNAFNEMDLGIVAQSDENIDVTIDCDTD